jgi:hypothetical protein
MTYQITAKALNVRKNPMGLIVGQLKQGDRVRVAEILSGWGRISNGWVSMAFVERVPSNHVLSTLALKYARLELGKGEVPRGSNWGKDVQGYLNSVGINVPAPWCMAFVYWVVEKASKELGQPNPLHKTGHVLTQWNASKKLRVVGTPERGDIFIMDFGNGKGHTGFVAEIKGDRIMTIEGNSNGQGSREGVEVCGKPNGRPMRSILGYIRLS